MWLRITQGHLPAGYGSYAPWGLWIAIYFHGVGIAGGAFALGALGYILDWPGFTDRKALRTTVILSFAAFMPAFLGVWLDLGHPERASAIMLSPNFTSMMAFNAWMYNGFMVVAAGAFLLSYAKESSWLKPLLCLAGVLSLMFPSQSGAFFGVVDAKPFWNSALMPMLFLTGAITAGAAMLLAVRGLVHGGNEDLAITRLRTVVLAGIAAYAVFEFAEFSIALWNPTVHAPEVELIMWGPFWWVFWIVHLAIGMALPVLLLLSRSRQAWWWGSLLVAICFISSRLNVLIPGQATGDLLGLQSAFQHERLTFVYQATAMEYLVGLFLVALGMGVFWIGQRIDSVLAAKAGTNA
jgi:molybdopterin-containing oxidoreductase family membrane subunit